MKSPTRFAVIALLTATILEAILLYSAIFHIWVAGGPPVTEMQKLGSTRLAEFFLKVALLNLLLILGAIAYLVWNWKRGGETRAIKENPKLYRSILKAKNKPLTAYSKKRPL